MRKNISVSLSESLLNDIDEVLGDRFSSRSDFLRYAAQTVLTQVRSYKAIEEFNKLLLKLSKDEDLSKEEIENLEKISNTVELLREVNND